MIDLLSEHESIAAELADHGIVTQWNGPAARLVPHLDISNVDVTTVIAAFSEILD